MAKRRKLDLSKRGGMAVSVSDDIEVTLEFDYSVIAEEHRAFVQETARLIKKDMTRVALRTGQRLNEIKEHFPHGTWEDFLRTEFNFSQARVPRLWMAAAARLGDKSEKFSVLPRSAVYLLGAESTPDEAVDEIEQRIEAGERIQVKDVERTIAKHRGEGIQTDREKASAPVEWLDLDGAIALIWRVLREVVPGEDTERRLEWLREHARVEDYAPQLQPGTDVAPGVLEMAHARVMREIASVIEYRARKQTRAAEPAAAHAQRPQPVVAVQPPEYGEWMGEIDLAMGNVRKWLESVPDFAAKVEAISGTGSQSGHRLLELVEEIYRMCHVEKAE